ncbi:MAG: gluconolaconase [bacterium]|nr:gluconolaconase [bacterium]
MATRKRKNGRPEIAEVKPAAAIPGGEFRIRGKGFSGDIPPSVSIGEEAAPVIIGSENYVIARVPEGAVVGEMTVGNGTQTSEVWSCDIGLPIADSLHPVANPAVDEQGNIFATFSGSRGQKTPVSVYKIDHNYEMSPYLTDLMNATALAFGRDGMLYISSRHDGIVYQATPSGDLSVYVEGMGVATGLAFDGDENLYVGDRSGTIFKISRDRQIFVFATIEASIAAYHLAMSPVGDLYVSGPTTSSFDSIHRVNPAGEVDVFYRGLGRPQGMAFDAAGNLYVAASKNGRKGVVRIDPGGEAELFLSGPNIVGLAFMPSRSMAVATNSALYRVDVDVAGLPLP